MQVETTINTPITGLSSKALSQGNFQDKLMQQISASDAKKDPEKTKQATQDFEAFFVTQMLGEMRKTIPKSEFLNGGPQEDMYRDLLDQEMGKEIAQGRGLGLAKMMYQQLVKSGSVNALGA